MRSVSLERGLILLYLLVNLVLVLLLALPHLVSLPCQFTLSDLSDTHIPWQGKPAI
jgi:hypothetical protein